MEMQEVISRAERNIRQALRDYGAHTSQTDVLDDVTDEFIYRLAADSSYAKQGLRKLFSKSPVWNEELDALVINGTRTHDPDYDRIHRLAMQILEKPFKSLDYDYNDILKAICFFSNPDAGTIVKYAILTLLGIWLYRLGADYAYAQRGYFAVGGEVLALMLPYFYWAASRTVKDFVADVKRR